MKNTGEQRQRSNSMLLCRPMTQERRRYPRIAKPIDGSWSGASGAADCRIADISWGGCFINTMAAPALGERTIVTLPIGGAPVTIEGKVVSVDRPMGFAVEFDPLTPEQVDALKPMLGDPPASLRE